MPLLSKERVESWRKLCDEDYEAIVATFRKNATYLEFAQSVGHWNYDVVLNAWDGIPLNVDIDLCPNEHDGTIIIKRSDLTITLTINEGCVDKAELHPDNDPEDVYVMTDQHIILVVRHAINSNMVLQNSDRYAGLFIAA